MFSKQLSQIKILLEKLCCPYLEDGDEKWLAELLLHPSESRIKLLQWLVTTYHTNFNELLNENIPAISNRIDSRHQKLLLALNVMGLCKIDDIEMVRGTAPHKKQINFWKVLINMCYISVFGHSFQHQQEDSMNDTSFYLKPARKPSLNETFDKTCKFIDTLLRENRISDIFTTKLNLLPPDIYEHIGNIENVTLPTLDMLVEMISTMTTDFEQIVLQSQKLKEVPQYNDVDQNIIESYCCKLELTLKMFSQMIDSFMQCYDNNMEPWCHRPKPRLTSLGSTISNVQYILDPYNTLQNSLTSLNKTSSYLSNELKKETKKLQDMKAHQRLVHDFRATAEILQGAVSRKRQK